MPTFSHTEQGANGTAHNWSHVSAFITDVKTFLNTTKLDYANLQTNGIRISNVRAHAGANAGGIKVRNDTGGSLADATLVYFSGTYNDGTDNYPTIAKAVSTQAVATTYYAQAIVDGAIADGADGTVKLCKEVSGLDTSGLAVGQRVLLSDTAGSYVDQLGDLAAADYAIQVVGFVTVVNASTGRIVFGNWSIIPWSNADQVVKA